MATIWDAATQTGSAATESTGVADRNYRTVIENAFITGNATSVRFLFSNSAGSNTMRIDGASIVQRSGTTDDGTTTPTRILFGAAATTTIAAGQTKWSDWLTFTIDGTKDYLVCLHVHAADPRSMDLWADADSTHYYETTSTDYTLEQTVSFTTHTNLIGLSQIESSAVSVSNNIADYLEV